MDDESDGDTEPPWTRLQRNPHCLQVKVRDTALRSQGSSTSPPTLPRRMQDLLRHLGNSTPLLSAEPPLRVLQPQAPGEPYRRRQGERKSVVHWGQRKLLLAEIEFLTLYSQPGQVVVYAGAAPGHHIGYLADLFPCLRFVLVDPHEFAVQPTPRVTVRQELFTDATALEFAGRNVLFLSDIRTGDWKQLSSEEVEEYIWRDMCDQQRWHLLMRPAKSMLKFRLPWPQGSRSLYLNGMVLLPIWGPQTTSECRLVPTVGMRVWENTLHNSQLFYFNTRTRVTIYPHAVRSEGLDHCYDCAAEVMVLRRYLLTFPQMWLQEFVATGTDDVMRAGTALAAKAAVETTDAAAAATLPATTAVQGAGAAAAEVGGEATGLAVPSAADAEVVQAQAVPAPCPVAAADSPAGPVTAAASTASGVQLDFDTSGDSLTAAPVATAEPSATCAVARPPHAPPAGCAESAQCDSTAAWAAANGIEFIPATSATALPPLAPDPCPHTAWEVYYASQWPYDPAVPEALLNLRVGFMCAEMSERISNGRTLSAPQLHAKPQQDRCPASPLRQEVLSKRRAGAETPPLQGEGPHAQCTSPPGRVQEATEEEEEDTAAAAAATTVEAESAVQPQPQANNPARRRRNRKRKR